MDDEAQSGLQRDLWRRAWLLTGEADAAERVLTQVLSVRLDPRRLTRAQRDRLIVQRSREVMSSRRGGVPGPGAGESANLSAEANQLLAAAWRLPRQSLEAWLLRDVEALEEIPAARAMDCSRTAMGRFREAALESLRPLLGDQYEGALAELHRAPGEADPEPALERIRSAVERARRRRRLKTAVMIAVFVLCAGLLVFVGFDLQRANDSERALRAIQDRFSAPMPAAEEGEPGKDALPDLREQERAPPAGRPLRGTPDSTTAPRP